MTATILDGKAIAAKVRKEVAERASAFRIRHGRLVGLEVVLVGDDAASVVYTRNKAKACEEAGMRGVLHRMPASSSTQDVLAKVRGLVADASVDGVLVQLPLPKHIDTTAVLDAVAPEKDVDGFHPVNVGRLASGRPCLVSCTPAGCMRLLDETGVSLAGARAVVVGRSTIVGKPMAQLLLARDATVTIAHSKTRDLGDVVREAEIVVAAVGRPALVRGDWIRPGAVVIDVGINRNDDGKLVGDVDFAGAVERASWITPVPGGVGPMTIAMLLANTVQAAEAAVAS
ncbi:MAG: bifunctional methylenetetrahydrofolate dehydrogenase/methenyltetrahydrofolate cyclohydrolase FolD [Deltaproteobacteria bacterium]|nr:bifunctional methylenetetrahydrofolate dehydrogenase/methenyltetrahydrofolate cyclohydrolase FolD [Deltaproteobacteria bacterium]